MNKNLSNEELYSTSNFYLAVFLHIRGFRLIDIDKSNPPRAQFVFLDTPKREGWIQSFQFAEKNSSEVMVDAREFEMAIKTLKDKLYQAAS